MENDLLIFLDK